MQTRWKTLLTMAGLLLATSLGASRTTPPATAAEVDVDLSVFYTSLAPYGEWVQLETYGWSWVPENVAYDWRPYTLGRWEWVEPIGWTWVSEEPFGWATYHYGRWTYVADYGWAWVPGTTWGPAWVAFRYGDPWVGWAPLPPGPSWRFDAGFDVRGLNLDVPIDAYAWSFVPVRYFAERDLRSRVYVTAYSSYFMQRTQWSTRYAAIEGGYANQSLDPVLVERSRGAPVVRRHLRESTAPTVDSPANASTDDVVVYRPRIRAQAPTQAPTPRMRGDRWTRAGLDSWTAERRAAIQARLDAQKKALEEEQPGATPATPNQPPPGMGTDDDGAKRREAGMKALEDERKRLEALLERQRRRREQEQPTPTPAPKNPPPAPSAPPAPPAPPVPPAPPGMNDGGHGKGMDDDDHGNGMDDDHHGMK